jgi:hypothetical protein
MTVGRLLTLNPEDAYALGWHLPRLPHVAETLTGAAQMEQVPGTGEAQVRTVKTEGSAWSKATVFSGQKRPRSYLKGA